jgi:excinuclease ABC subunit A
MQKIPANSKILILAPMVKDRKGEYQAIFNDLRKQGYSRVRVDKQIHELSGDINLDKNKKHSIEVVVDRIVTGQSGSSGRIADSVEDGS